MADPMNKEGRRGLSAGLLGAITRVGMHKHLPITGTDGARPIVIAFGDESIGEVLERVSWSDGFANLFIVMGPDDIALASMLPSMSALHERDAEPLELLVSDSPIAMLVELGRS